jgi:hypothetical protein
MSGNKKTIAVVSITTIFAFGLGIAVGNIINAENGFEILGIGNILGAKNNSLVSQNLNLQDNTVEELGVKLSEVMLPEDEFLKLESAIFQTAMGLFMAQAHSAGITVTENAQNELKKNIDEKYSRKYFSDMNSDSMKEMSKQDLISILSFYDTESGQKFLELSPKIIQSTMSAVQADLSQWLPKTVDELVAKLKGENNKPEDSNETTEGKELNDGAEGNKAKS